MHLSQAEWFDGSPSKSLINFTGASAPTHRHPHRVVHLNGDSRKVHPLVECTFFVSRFITTSGWRTRRAIFSMVLSSSGWPMLCACTATSNDNCLRISLHVCWLPANSLTCFCSVVWATNLRCSMGDSSYASSMYPWTAELECRDKCMMRSKGMPKRAKYFTPPLRIEWPVKAVSSTKGSTRLICFK